MSSAPTEESVEQTKRQIRTLVGEIAELSQQNTLAADYYPAVLQRIVSALAAPGGAVWLNEGGVLRPTYQVQVTEDMIQRGGEAGQQHLRLLGQLLVQGQPEMVPPRSVFGPNGELANPTDFLLIVAPLLTADRSVGLIEIFQRPDTHVDAQRGYLKFIEHVLKLIGEWLKGHAFQQVSERQQLWQKADEFARLAHNSLDVRDTAFTIANEARRVIGCDRVSVAVMRGRNARLIAMSGQDTVESRSNEVQALNRLATRVVRGKEDLWYDGTTSELPPQIEDALDEYVDLSHGRTVTVMPIREPEKPIAGDVLADRDAVENRMQTRRIIGALIVEQIETVLTRSELEGRIDLVYEHTCRAMSNSLQHSNLFLMPVWKLLDRTTWLFRGSALPKTATAIALVTAAVAALCFVHVDFDLEAKGALKPLVEQNVFAHVDGEVKDVFVSHGDEVKAGQPLVLLNNPALQQQLEEIRGGIAKAIENQHSIRYTLNLSNLSEVERRRLNAELAESEATQTNLQAQLNILQERYRQLQRTSPIDGIVTTWDVEKLLRARPVATGQALLNIASFEQDWYIEAFLPEKRMKHLDAAFAEANSDFLPCEFILKSNPASVHTGTLHKRDVHQQAQVNGDEGTAVRLHIVPDSMEGISRLPGAEVTVDVKCGTAPAGYAWFYEIPEWIRANVIF